MPDVFGGDARGAYERASKQTRDKAGPLFEFLGHGFSVTWFREQGRHTWLALLKPHPHMRDYFTMPMEYLLIGHGFAEDFQQRTLLAEPPQDIAYRVDPRVRFVASDVAMMRAACAAWAVEQRVSVVPIELTQAAVESDPTARLYRVLSSALWARDVYDDPEPVTDPSEFFGRELAVQEIVTKVYLGQLTAVFGLRKIGKTSLLRRVRGLLESDASSQIATAFIQCNATRIRSARWHVVVRDLVELWSESINRQGALLTPKIEVRSAKLSGLFADGRNPSDAAVADAFQKDVEKLVRASQSLASARGVSNARLVAFFDEADELYPDRTDAGFWQEDYFLLWNALQTLKRGLDDPRMFVFVLAGVNPAGVEAGAFRERPNPLFEMSRLFLKPLIPSESRALVLGLGSRVGLSFDDQALEAILEITGGHPWLVRKLGSYVHRSIPERSSATVVSRANVETVFSREKKSFFQHVQWILSHLKAVAPDEYKLLKDIAVGGELLYLSEWKDRQFRDAFAQHLAEYGVVRFEGVSPVIAVGLIREALTHEAPSALPEQKRRLREAGDLLEALLRARIVNDVAQGRTLNEAVKLIVDSVPREAKNRPKTREELRQIGESAGLHALVQSLNWGDYLLIVANPEAGIAWVGADLQPAERRSVIDSAVKNVHLARHNNDAELRTLIDRDGFEPIWHAVSRAIEMLPQ